MKTNESPNPKAGNEAEIIGNAVKNWENIIKYL